MILCCCSGGPSQLVPNSVREGLRFLSITLPQNRSYAYLLPFPQNYTKALQDAQIAVSLKPDWAKAHSRVGAANHGLNTLDEAKKAYHKGRLNYRLSRACQLALSPGLTQTIIMVVVALPAPVSPTAAPPCPRMVGISGWQTCHECILLQPVPVPLHASPLHVYSAAVGA